MQKEPTYYQQLLLGFIDNELELVEVDELLAFIQSDPEEYDRLLNAPLIRERLEQKAYDDSIVVHDLASQRMKDRLMQVIGERETQEDPPRRGRIIPIRTWVRWAAASV